MDTVELAIDARGVARLTLDRPDKHNAMSARMIAEITAGLRSVGEDPAVRVLVLQANGRSFCAGGDLGWMRQQMEADRDTRIRGATALAEMLQTLDTCPKPVIARVQGNAFGGGVGLIATCDVVISTDSAVFGLTETRLGLIPATIGPYVCARIGATMARRVILSGRSFDAVEAERMGLVSRVVRAPALDAAVDAEIAEFLRAAPGAIADAKAQIRRLSSPIDAAIIAESVDALVARWDGTEAPDGIAAFFARKPPPWAPVTKE